MSKNCKNSAAKGRFITKSCFKVTPKFFFFLAFCKSKNSCSLLCNLRDISLFTNCFDQRHKGSRTKNRQETDHLKALAYVHEKKFICKTSSTYHQLTKQLQTSVDTSFPQMYRFFITRMASPRPRMTLLSVLATRYVCTW